MAFESCVFGDVRSFGAFELECRSMVVAISDETGQFSFEDLPEGKPLVLAASMSGRTITLSDPLTLGPEGPIGAFENGEVQLVLRRSR